MPHNLLHTIGRRAPGLLVPIAVAILFGSVLRGSDRLAFRDVSHFYTPLYRYVAERCDAQWLPLWNPLDATGIPLAGETTTAVFYPIRYFLFQLPLATESAIGFYVALHLIIASTAATWTAKQSGVNDKFAAIAGVVYPLCGSVFFLHTNLPFLVSAAWLPIVLAALVTQHRQESPAGSPSFSIKNRILLAGFALAMMVLGGDPQTALHAVMVSTAAMLIRPLKGPRDGRFRATLISICGACTFAAFLAAPQIASSMSWSMQSSRVAFNERDDWASAPTTDSRRNEAYQFSLPPWHLAELVTPWASGSLFPEHQRLSQVMPGDGRMWTPSIYVSMLGLMALLGRITSRRRQPIDCWLVLAIGSIGLSLGHFGLVWVVQQTGLFPNIDSAIGGPYWFLYQFFPFYDSYRYPVKWLPLFAIAMAIMTAKWTETTAQAWTNNEQNFRQSQSKMTRAIGVTIVCALAVALGLLLLDWQPSLASKIADEYWGPLHWNAGLQQLAWSLTHSLTVLLLISGLLFASPASIRISPSVRLGLMMILLTLDLAICNWPLIATTPCRVERSLIANQESVQLRTNATAMRMQSDGGWPIDWKNSRSATRITEVAAAERMACFGRWHLEHQINVFNSMTSIRSRDVEVFWRWAAQSTKGMSHDQQTDLWNSIQQWLRLTDIVHIDAGKPVQTDGAVLPRVTWRKVHYPPETRRNQQARFLSSKECTPERFNKLLTSMVKKKTNHDVLVCWDESPFTNPSQIEIQEYGTAALIKMEAAQTKLIVRSVYQDGHWRATLFDQKGRSQPTTVCKVDFLKQGVVVPPGEWTVRFEYRPWWITPTLAIAAIAWGYLLINILTAAVGRNRTLPSSTEPASSPSHPVH